MQSFDVYKQNTWSVMGCAVSINLRVYITPGNSLTSVLDIICKRGTVSSKVLIMWYCLTSQQNCLLLLFRV